MKCCQEGSDNRLSVRRFGLFSFSLLSRYEENEGRRRKSIGATRSLVDNAIIAD